MAKLTQDELAERWRISPRTLEQWRWLGGMSTATNLTPLSRIANKKGSISAQPVELRDDQGSAGDLRQVQRLRQFRPVGLATTLDLHEPR
jgi:hypothetical protein